MPHASTFTRTWPAPASGISRSTNSKSPPGLPICATFIFLVMEPNPVFLLTSAQSQSLEDVYRQNTGHTQAVVTLVADDGAPCLRAGDAVDLAAIITLSRELLLRGSNG